MSKKTTKPAPERPADDQAEPLRLTRDEAREAARLAFKLAGFTDAAPDEYGNRAGDLAEVIGSADTTTARHFTRAILFAASAQAEAIRTNGPAIRATARRAVELFKLADEGRAAALETAGVSDTR